MSNTETEQRHTYVVSSDSRRQEYVFELPEDVAEEWRGQDITIDPNGSAVVLPDTTVETVEEHNAK